MFASIMSNSAGAMLADPNEQASTQQVEHPHTSAKQVQYMDEFKDIADVDPNPEQQNVLDSIFASRVNHNDLHLHIVSGVPGAGKTFLAKKLAVEYEMRGKCVVICASTGSAALRLSKHAQTVHKTFLLPVCGVLAPLRPSHLVHQILAAADVIFLDEYSMVTSDTLNYITHRLLQVCTAIGKPLSSKTLILFGDPAQLPPVCRHHKEDAQYDTICNNCHITASVAWNLGHTHFLSSSMRHANDPEHISFLNIIRHRKPSQHEIDTHLRDCFVTKDYAMQTADQDTTFLCTHVSDVIEINSQLAQKFFGDALISVEMSTNASNIPGLQSWVNAPKFHTLTHVAVGAPVMLTTNIDLSTGASNGATGTVTHVKSLHGKVVRIDVMLSNGALVKVNRTHIERRPLQGKMYHKSTFPLTLAYAMTGHKCQGATIRNKVVLYIRKAFCPGLLYVMFSRVLTRNQISIIGCLTPEDFIPIPDTYLPTNTTDN